MHLQLFHAPGHHGHSVDGDGEEVLGTGRDIGQVEFPPNLKESLSLTGNNTLI